MELSAPIWAAFKALVIAFVLTPIVRDIFRAYNVVDRPGGRTVHAYPTPRVGGVSVAIAWAIAILVAFDPKAPLPDYYSEVLQLVPGALIIFLTGLLDDFLNLRPLYKLLGQMAAAATVFASGLRIEDLLGFHLPLWFSLLASVFWLLLATNALNLIDGLDGLCGGIGFLAALTLFAAGMIREMPALTFAMLPLAGALLGFLFFNFNPATVFMGDSGALMVGFLLGCGGMMWKNSPTGGGLIAVPLLAMSLPLLDVSISVVRRKLKGKPIFSADRGHLHHRVLDRSRNVRRAALTLYAMALPGVAAALILSRQDGGSLQRFVLPAYALLAGAGIVRLWYCELEVAWGLLFRDEFRQLAAAKVRLEQLRIALQRADSEDEWWKLLSAFGRQEGWLRMEWNSRVPRSLITAPRPADWSFRIPINADESLLVEGDLARKSDSVDLVEFSRVVARTLPANRFEADLPAVS